MKSTSFWHRTIFGIRYNELGLVLLLYLFFGFAYNMAIYMTSGGQAAFIPNIFYDYGLKGLYTIPIWWLFFKKLNHWKIWQKLLLHLVWLPIYVVGWQQSYYWVMESVGLWHLSWPGAWWDIYIPGLFYVLQFGIFHVYEYYRELQRQYQLQAELREIALKSELTALKAQLNPHFLYNTFNTISASVPPQQETTREMIAKLSDLFRYQLKGSKVDVVPLKEEIAFVQNYLELEKARFGERLQFIFNVDKSLEDAPVPPMILQPIVENAIKHGISPKIDGGIVSIKVLKKNEHIYFEICDSGVGIAKELTTQDFGVGLTNTKKRLEKMYNSDLNIKNMESGGVCVQFEIEA